MTGHMGWLFEISIVSYGLLTILLKLINALRDKDYSYARVLLTVLSLSTILAILLLYNYPTK